MRKFRWVGVGIGVGLARLVRFAGLLGVVGCQTAPAGTLLSGKRCSLVQQCVAGYSCHPLSDVCVTATEEQRLRAEGKWESGQGGTSAKPDDSPPVTGGGLGGEVTGGSAGAMVTAPPSATVPIKPPEPDSGPDVKDSGIAPGVNPNTGALIDRVILCGNNNPQKCTGEEVCCALYEKVDVCIPPGGACDCTQGCDIAHCAGPSDCPAGTVCCFERNANPGGTRCKQAANCVGPVLCDPSLGVACDGECTYKVWLYQNCELQDLFVP
ncbi:MAG: hypothetical protein RJA70_1877 [Pseudomonadota bacterium]|jgi:hypothetical protein